MSVLNKKLFSGFILLLVFVSFWSFAQAPASREYQVKAVFLYNFTQFVEWPVESLGPGQQMVVGVIGPNPFGSFLSETITGEIVNGHPLMLKQCNSSEDAKNCHILFVNYPDAAKQKQLIESLKGRSVLTVCDGVDFLQQGGMIRFFTKNNKILLQVNLSVVEASNLKISSKLLRLAEIYPAK